MSGHGSLKRRLRESFQTIAGSWSRSFSSRRYPLTNPGPECRTADDRQVIKPARKHGGRPARTMKPLEEDFPEIDDPVPAWRTCFDLPHAGHEHRFRPDQEPAGQNREADRQAGRDNICTNIICTDTDAKDRRSQSIYLAQSSQYCSEWQQFGANQNKIANLDILEIAI